MIGTAEPVIQGFFLNSKKVPQQRESVATAAFKQNRFACPVVGCSS